jgi:hypothetical protein
MISHKNDGGTVTRQPSFHIHDVGVDAALRQRRRAGCDKLT